MSPNPWLPATSAPAAPSNPWMPSGPSVATNLLPPGASDTTGPLGFLGNVVSGLEGLGTGIAHLAGSALHDVAKAGTEAVTLGKADVLGGYQLDDVAKATIPAIIHDYAQRYGPLFHGHVGEFLHEVYTNPVSFALDALTVASLGAGAEAKLGQAVLDANPAAARLATETAAQLEEAGTAAKTAQYAGIRTGLESLAQSGVDTGTAGALNRLLPSLTAHRVGDSLVAGATLRNPLSRVAYGATLEKALTSPLGKVADAIDTGPLGAMTAIPSDVNRVGLEQGIVSEAQQLGLSRLDKPGIAEARASQLARTVRNVESGAWFRDRVRAVKQYKDIWNAAIKEDPSIRNIGSAWAMGLNYAFNGFEPDSKIVSRIEQQLGHPLTHIDLGAAPFSGTPTAVADTARTTLAGDPIVERTDAVVARLNEFIANVQKDSEAITARGMDPAAEIDGAQRMIDQLNAEVNRYSSYSPLERAIMKTRLLDAEGMANSWDSLEYTPASMLDAQFRPLQVMHGSSTTRGLAKANVEAAQQTVQDWLDKRATRIQNQSTQAIAKVGSWADRRASALFNKQTFDRPLSLNDAARVATQELADGAAPRSVLDALDVARRYGETAPGTRTAEQAYANLVSQVNPPATTPEAQTLAASQLEANTPQTIAKALERIQVGEDHISWQQIDDSFRAHNLQPPVYYPHIDATRIKTSDWFRANPVESGAMRRALDPHWKYNEEVLLRRGQYITDPVEAYARRAARSVRMDGTANLIHAIATSPLARPISKPSDLAAGERIFSPDYLRMVRRTSQRFQDLREQLTAEGQSPEQAAMSALDTVVRENQDEVARLAEKGGIKLYAVPEVVGRRLSDTARAAGLINGRWAKIYLDGPMNVWRSMVLAGSPRWIVNNVIGNTIFSAMQGAPIGRAFHLLEQRFAKVLNENYGMNLNTGLLDEVQAKLDSLGIRDQVDVGYNRIEELPPPQVPATSGGGFGEQVFQKSRAGGYAFMNKAHNIATRVRDLNSEIEAAFRENSALTALERSAGINRVSSAMRHFMSSHDYMERVTQKGFTEARATAALNEVNHFFGDFTNLGPFERHVIRRFIFPFWGFTKFQAKLLLSYPFLYPARAEVLNALANTTKELSAQYGVQPDWLAGAVPLSPPGVNPTQFLTTSGPNPFNATFQNPLSGLSPLLKIPLEHFTGRSLYTDQRFTDQNVVTPFGSDQQFRIIFGPDGKPVGAEPIAKVTPSILEAALSQLPQYQALKELIAGGKTYDTAGILQAIKGRVFGGPTGAIVKNGQVAYPAGTAALLSKLLGFPVTEYDLQNYQKFLQLQEGAAVKTYVKNQGAA